MKVLTFLWVLSFKHSLKIVFYDYSLIVSQEFYLYTQLIDFKTLKKKIVFKWEKKKQPNKKITCKVQKEASTT